MDPIHIQRRPTYHLPKFKNLDPKAPYVRALVVLLVVFVVLGLAAALVMYGPAASFISATFMPKELRTSYFIADTREGATAYRPTSHSYATVPTDGTLVSIDGLDTARITRDKENRYHVLNQGVAVLATTTPIVGITRSPDGSTIAFGAALDANRSTFQYAYDLPIGTLDVATTRIDYVRQMGSTTVTMYGPTGASPMFLDDSHIAYFAPLGLFVLDTHTGATTKILDGVFLKVPLSVLASPDHTHLGIRDSKARTVTVYQVTPTSANIVATVPLTKAASSYALGNDALYIVRVLGWGTEISKHSFGEKSSTQPILFLPESLQVDRLLITTL